MTPLEAALVEVGAALDSLSVPHVLIGGLAVSLWGEPRATLDLDLLVWVERQDLESSIAGLCGRLRALPGDPVAFVRQTQVLPVETSQGVRADLIFARLPYERQAIGRGCPKQVASQTVRVASVEDLVLMKLVSERQRDIDDARRLLRRYKGKLDSSYLEPRLVELAEALARPDILQILREES